MDKWSMKKIKADGRAAMKRNYWPYVIVSLILGFITANGAALGSRAGEGYSEESGNALPDLQSVFSDPAIGWSVVAATLIAIGAIAVVVMLVEIALKVFVFNPLEVGCRSFFLISRNGKAQVEQVGAGYTGNYRNVVKVQFLRALFTCLWSLLFIIPGIVKMYEYRMIPYIMAESPNVSREEAFRMSREMMNGQKWRTFLYDLSFIGWWLLSLLTFGILIVFYAQPYYNAACAELYITLRDRIQGRKPEITGTVMPGTAEQL